jgi:cysteinyl-tRNA synthetase
MSAKYLGETFDLHGGGRDLIFPHHENELAQSQASTGKPMCACWMHGGFLDLDGAKMSKSLGNVVRLRDALQKVDSEALRYFFLSTHYRQQLNFSDKSLEDAEARLEYFYETLKKVDERVGAASFPEGPLHGLPGRFLEQFHQEMSDDFNVAGALGVVAGLFNELNLLTDKPPVKDKVLIGRTLKVLRGSVTTMAAVLGIFEGDPAEWLARRRDRQVLARGIDVKLVESRIAARNEARGLKTPAGFTEADRIRAELRAGGVEIMDTPQGTTWKVAVEKASGQ